MKTPVVTTKVRLPSFGRVGVCPEIPVDLYRERFSKAMQRLHAERIDTLLVYADREHCAALMYFSGFDPRLSPSHSGRIVIAMPKMGWFWPTKHCGRSWHMSSRRCGRECKRAASL